MSKKLKGLVFTALDNALEGGYAGVVGAAPEAEARSLMDYDADVADEVERLGAGEVEVAAAVREWQSIKSKESKNE